jgi:hypothetical protein
MNPEELERVLGQRPFVPVMLHVSNGQMRDIRHPEAAIVGKRVVAVGVHEEGEKFPNIQLVSLLHINQIEPIGAAMG